MSEYLNKLTANRRIGETIGHVHKAMSKRYDLFKKKIDQFYVDCEFAEYIAENHNLLSNKSTGGFNVKHKNQFTHISAIDNSYERGKVANHLIQSIYSSFIKDIYEELNLYLIGVLSDVIILKQWNIDRLIGSNNVDIKAKEILNASTYNEIIDIAVKKIFRSLEEEKSTINLLDKINRKLGLENIPKAVINDAMPYLELRHVLVHSDGKPDDDFKKKYQVFKIPQKKKIRLYHCTIADAYRTICLLVKSIDNDLMNRNLIK